MSSLCDTPDKAIKKKFRKRKYSYSTGKGAGHRYRGKPKMLTSRVNFLLLQGADGASYPDPSTLFEVSHETNEMWDTHGFQQNHCNPCVQEKYLDGTNAPIESIYDADGELFSFGDITPCFRPLFRSSLPFLTGPFLDELALKSETKLSSVVDSNVSIVNFILELIEMCHGNIKIVKRFDKIYRRCMAEFAKAFRRYIKQGHKELAANWLAWNFAIKPFIKDLRALLCSITDSYKKMDWLRKHNHREVILHYKRAGLENDLPVSLPTAWFTGGQPLVTITRADPDGTLINGSYAQQVRILKIDLSYHAFSRIFLEIPDYLLEAGGRGMGALWAAMQGITNPVGIVWEAIPFSWLVDYFLSYRARLFQTMYDMNPFNEGVTVLGFGHCWRYTAIGEGRIQNTTNDFTHMNYGSINYSLYGREKGLPYPGQESLFRVPDNWYKASIIGALFIGFLPKRRR